MLQVIFTVNSPGEVYGWLKGCVCALRTYAREHSQKITVIVAPVPCPFAGGEEYRVACGLPGVDHVLQVKQTAWALLGRVPVDFPVLPAGGERVCVYMGGEPAHALLLGRTFKCPAVAYVEYGHFLWRFFKGLACSDEALCARLRQRLPASLPIKCVGRLSLDWEAEEIAPASAGERPFTVGLFPGSRSLLLLATLNPFLRWAGELAASQNGGGRPWRFILSVSPFVTPRLLRRALAKPLYAGVEPVHISIDESAGEQFERLSLDGGQSVEVVWGRPFAVMAQLDAALAIPGTTTGQLAGRGIPFVVVLSHEVPLPRGGLGWFIEHFPGFKAFKRWSHVRMHKRHPQTAQPNIIAQELIAPEITVEHDLRVLFPPFIRWYECEEERRRVARRLQEVMEAAPGQTSSGGTGACLKMASLICEVAQVENRKVKFLNLNKKACSAQNDSCACKSRLSALREKVRQFFFKWRGAVMAVLALFVLVQAQPTVASLKIGLALSLVGECIRLWALGYAGEPTRSQSLTAPKLVTCGPYALARNPLYIGNAFNALGTCAACCGGLAWDHALLLWLISVEFLYVVYWSCIACEEQFLDKQFGEQYREYCRNVPRFWPNLAHLGRAFVKGDVPFRVNSLRFETFSLIWLFLVWAYLAFRVWG